MASEPASTSAATSAATSAGESPAVVAAECRVFAHFLADTDASSYVQHAYAKLLPTSDVPSDVRDRLIERALLSVARQGTLPARVADGYARFFLPRSVLRRRLVLMLAILENSPGSERLLNSGDEGSLIGVGVRLILTGIASVLCSMVGVVVFAPLHLMSGGSAAQPERLH